MKHSKTPNDPYAKDVLKFNFSLYKDVFDDEIFLLGYRVRVKRWDHEKWVYMTFFEIGDFAFFGH